MAPRLQGCFENKGMFGTRFPFDVFIHVFILIFVTYNFSSNLVPKPTTIPPTRTDCLCFLFFVRLSVCLPKSKCSQTPLNTVATVGRAPQPATGAAGWKVRCSIPGRKKKFNLARSQASVAVELNSSAFLVSTGVRLFVTDVSGHRQSRNVGFKLSCAT